MSLGPTPEKTRSDLGHTVALAVLSSVPVGGGAIAALFEHVFSAPIEKRREEWLKRLSQTVDELLERVEGLTAEDLSKNDRFISASLHASQIAARTHQAEKLTSLQNALANIALRDGNEDLESLYLRLVDELTPLHVRLLDFQSSPQSYVQKLSDMTRRNVAVHYSSLAQVWNELHHDFPANAGATAMVCRDLFIRGLSRQEDMRGGIQKITTKLGDEFLTYIRTPLFASNKT